MVLEQIIVLVLKHIMSKERMNAIETTTIKNTIKSQFSIERFAMQKQQQKFNERWDRLNRELRLE